MAKKELPSDCNSHPLDKPLTKAYSVFKGNGPVVGYQLVVTIPFDAMDDIHAREKARDYFENSGLSNIDDPKIKLQKLFGDRPPQGLALPLPPPANSKTDTSDVTD